MPKSVLRQRLRTLALALALLPAALRATGPSFNSSSFAAGTTPVYIAIADFNGDGRQDIAVANQGSGNVTVLLAKAGGGYNSSTVTMTGGITSIVAADLNGDGKIDLAIGNPNASGNITYLLNDGAGNFTQTAMNPVLNAAPKFVVAPDLNTDGYADIVWSDGTAAMDRIPSTTTSGGLFAGFSQFGSFGYGINPSSPSAYPGSAAGGFMAVGDVNNNGRVDVVVVTNKNDIVTMDGNGSGAISATWWSALPTGTQSKFVALADVNNDGKLDALVTCNDGNVYVMLGNGTGAFTLVGTGTAFGGSSANGVAAGDFNGDGFLDLAVTSSADPSVYILLGNGTGSFATPAALVLPLGSAGSGGSVVAKDVNGDGKIDLVATDKTNGQVFIFLNSLPSISAPALLSFHSVTGGAAPASQTAALSFISGTAPGFNIVSDSAWLSAAINGASPPTSLTIMVDPTKVTFGAFTGKLTLTATGYFGTTIQVSLNVVTPDGTLTAGTALNFGGPPTFFAIADMNHDGIPDLVVLAGSTVYSMKNNGSGAFTNKSNIGVANNIAGLAIADFNGDGNLDVATSAPNFSSSLTEVYVLLGDGNSGLGVEGNLVAQGGFLPTATVSGDFNGDGKADIAVLNSAKVVGSDNTSTLMVFLGTGAAEFVPVSGIPRDLSGLKGAAMKVGDFNGDGKLDLAIVHQQASASNTTQGALTILLGNGDGTFAEASGSPYLTGNTSTSLAMGDFNNDGFTDLAVGAQADSTHSITVLLGNGTGAFTSSDFAVTPHVQGLTAADFDGDGNIDLAAVNVTGNADLIMLGNGAGTFGTPFSIAGNVTSGAAGSMVTGDFTGDGATDLVSTGNSNQLNFFKGSKSPTTTTLTSPPSSRLVVGQAITFASSTVASSGWVKPGGAASFVDGANTYPAGNVNSAGQASTDIALTLGSHSFYASYAGDVKTSPSDSSALPVSFTSYTPTLSFSTTPSGAKVGTKLTTFTVSVVDPQSRAAAPQYNASITLTLNGGSFDAASTAVVTAVAGVATFSNLIIDTPGNYTITATTTGGTTATGTTFAVGSNPATHFSVTGFPNPTTAGTAGTVTVTALDSLGFTAGSYTGTVRITSSDSQANLPANYTFTLGDGGVHILQVTLDTAGNNYSITATDVANGTITGTQTGITTKAGTVPAFVLSYAGTPQVALAGTPFAGAISAKVTDAGHNGIAGVTVNFAAPGVGPSAALSSATAITDATGVASVNVTANGVVGNYNIVASVNSLSASFALFNTDKCDVNIDGMTTATDVHLIVDQALGVSRVANDLNRDNALNVVDMQIVVNAAVGNACSAS